MKAAPISKFSLNSTEKLFVFEYIYKRLIKIADEDYVAARMLCLTDFPRQYFWSACQALEKYTKALYLLHNRSAKFSHKFADPIIDLSQNGEINLPDQLVLSIPVFEMSETRSTKDVIRFFEIQGSATKRYGDEGIELEDVSLQFLDMLVFHLRRNFFEPNGHRFEINSTHQTAAGDDVHQSKNRFEILGSALKPNEKQEYFGRHNFAFFPETSPLNLSLKTASAVRRHSRPKDIDARRFDEIVSWIEGRMKKSKKMNTSPTQQTSRN